MNIKTLIKILTFVFISTLFLSCTKEDDNKLSQNTDKQSSSKKTAIALPKERALARWNALIKKEWTEAYSYETPSYRKNYTRLDFINSFGSAVTWVSIKHISSAEVNDKLIDMKLQLLFLYDMGGGGGEMKIPTMVEERWQLIDNNWWHIKALN